MVANFRMTGVVTLFEEIGLLVKLASHNQEIEAKHAVQTIADDPKALEAAQSAIEAIGPVLKLTTNLLEFVKSGHIKDAAERLNGWTTDERRRWNELALL